MASVFDEFVKRKMVKPELVDWTKRQHNWLKKLDQLFDSVTVYLKEFIDNGSIQLSPKVITLFEEQLGHYEAKALSILIGDSKVELRPAGTVLIGGIGRVDLVGRRAEIMLVLAPKDSDGPSLRVLTPEEAKQNRNDELNWDDWTWKIAQRQPTLRYIELDKQSFQGALMSAAD